jgi:hypothetical protein
MNDLKRPHTQKNAIKRSKTLIKHSERLIKRSETARDGQER